jgi:hypothetical protein
MQKVFGTKFEEGFGTLTKMDEVTCTTFFHIRVLVLESKYKVIGWYPCCCMNKLYDGKNEAKCCGIVSENLYYFKRYYL